MGYLLGLMWICLGVAAVIGYVLAYLFQRTSYLRLHANNEQSWLARLRQTEQDRDTRIARLTSEVEEHRTQAPTMERSLAERSDIINGLESQLEAQKGEVKTLQQQLDQARSETGDSAQAVQDAQRVSELESELKARGHEVSVLHADLEQLRTKHNETNARAIAAEKALGEQEAAQHEQQTLFDSHQQSQNEANNKLAESGQKIEQLKKELSGVNSRYATLEREHGGCAAQLNGVSKKLSAIQSELEQQRSDSNRLHEQNRAQSKELEQTKTRLEELTAESANYQANLRSQIGAAEELEASEQRLASARSEREKLESELAQAQLRTNELEQAQRSRVDELNVVTKENTEFKNKLAQLEVHIAESDEKHNLLATELSGAQSRAQEARDEFSKWRDQAQELDTKLQGQLSSSAEARQQAERWQNEHDKLKAQLANQEALVTDAQQATHDVQHELSATNDALEAAREKNVQWQQRLDDSNKSAATQIRELKARIAEMESATTQAGKLDGELAMLRRTLEARDAEFAREHQTSNEQRQLAREWKQRYEALQKERADSAHKSAQASTKKPARKSSRSTSSKAASTTASDKPDWLLSEAPKEKDDLKKIWGVGPVMEKTMNGLGIYLFRQVAALRKKDIEWIASHINTFPDRINRDDWVGQAAKLRKEKYGR